MAKAGVMSLDLAQGCVLQGHWGPRKRARDRTKLVAPDTINGYVRDQQGEEPGMPHAACTTRWEEVPVSLA